MNDLTKVHEAIAHLKAITGRDDLTGEIVSMIRYQQSEIARLQRLLDESPWRRFLKWFNGPKGGM